jgi:hypothetical protein
MIPRAMCGARSGEPGFTPNLQRFEPREWKRLTAPAGVGHHSTTCSRLYSFTFRALSAILS